MFMSREARRLINFLNEEAKIHGVQGFTISAHLYIADYISVSYYMAPIINMIKSRIRSSNKQYKQFTTEYWLPIIESMMSKQNGVKRIYDGMGISPILTDNITQQYEKLTDFIGSDYSISEAEAILRIVNTTGYNRLCDACNEAQKYGASSALYVQSVLNSIAKQDDTKNRIIQQLTEKIEGTKVGVDIVYHTPLELAQMEYELQCKRENAELVRKFKELTENDT